MEKVSFAFPGWRQGVSRCQIQTFGSFWSHAQLLETLLMCLGLFETAENTLCTKPSSRDTVNPLSALGGTRMAPVSGLAVSRCPGEEAAVPAGANPWRMFGQTRSSAACAGEKRLSLCQQKLQPPH